MLAPWDADLADLVGTVRYDHTSSESCESGSLGVGEGLEVSQVEGVYGS